MRGVIVRMLLVLALVFGGLVWYWSIFLSTKYAPGYSGAKFRRVTLGMPEHDVKRLLGQPLSFSTNSSDGWIYWFYTLDRHLDIGPADAFWRQRWVATSNGSVVWICNEVGVD